MEAEAFEKQAVQDPEIRALLMQAAQEMADEADEDEPKRFIDPVTVMVSFVAYVLFRVAKDSLDRRRHGLELQSAADQLELVDKLTAEGWPREKAETAVAATMKAIGTRSHDDPILTKVFAMIGKK